MRRCSKILICTASLLTFLSVALIADDDKTKGKESGASTVFEAIFGPSREKEDSILTRKLDSLREIDNALQIQIKKKRDSLDTLKHAQNLKERSISEKESTLAGLESYVAGLGTCISRLGDCRLSEGNSERMQMEYYKRLINRYGGTGQKGVVERLDLYISTRDSLNIILNEAMQEPHIPGEDNVKNFKQKYKSKILAMPYCGLKKLYHHSTKAIPKLDARIDEAFRRLEAHTAEKPADFKDLIFE